MSHPLWFSCFPSLSSLLVVVINIYVFIEVTLHFSIILFNLPLECITLLYFWILLFVSNLESEIINEISNWNDSLTLLESGLERLYFMDI